MKKCELVSKSSPYKCARAGMCLQLLLSSMRPHHPLVSARTSALHWLCSNPVPLLPALPARASLHCLKSCRVTADPILLPAHGHPHMAWGRPEGNKARAELLCWVLASPSQPQQALVLLPKLLECGMCSCVHMASLWA